MARSSHALLTFLAALLSVSAVSAADRLAPASTPASHEEGEAEARTLVRRGLAAYARGEHAAALADYERASALVPDANLPWLYRAEALRALGRNNESIAAYERYLSIDPNVSDAAAVRAKIEVVRALRRGKVTLETQPPGARVSDVELGTLLGATPLTLSLLPGPRRLRLERDGYVPQTVDVEVAAGDARFHKFALTSVPPRARAASPCQGRRIGGATLGGIGLATVVAGVVLDVAVAGAAKSDFERDRAAGDNDAAARASSRYQASGLGAGVAYVLGASLVAAGITTAAWPCERRPRATALLDFQF